MMRLARDAAKPSKVVTGTIATALGKFSEYAPLNASRPTPKFPTMKMLTPLVSPHILPKTLRTFLNIWLQTLLRASNPPLHRVLFLSEFLRLPSLLSPIIQLLQLLNPRPQPMTPPSRNSLTLLSLFPCQMFPSKSPILVSPTNSSLPKPTEMSSMSFSSNVRSLTTLSVSIRNISRSWSWNAQVTMTMTTMTIVNLLR